MNFVQIVLRDLAHLLAWVNGMKRFLFLLVLFSLTLLVSVSPTLMTSVQAVESADVMSTSPKDSTGALFASAAVSRRYWVNYSDLPRNTLGRINTAAIANWNVDLPNDNREYLYNPVTRELTAISDLVSRGQLPSTLIELATNTTPTSVRICRKGLRLLNLPALRCRVSDLAELPRILGSTSNDNTTDNSTTNTGSNNTGSNNTGSNNTGNNNTGSNNTGTTNPGNSNSGGNTSNNSGNSTTNPSQTPIDVALRNVSSVVPTTGDRIGGLAVTQGWHSRHMGIDLALPPVNGRWPDSTGTPVYAIGAPGIKVEVRCWYEPIAGQNASTYSEGMDYAFDYAHLDTCVAGERGTATVNAGDRIGTIGNTGAATTGPHLHFQQRRNGTSNPITGEHMQPWRGYIEIAVSGAGTNSVASNR
jgi:murein DD-endopeptidase MepM/ murein hydrolase activator NlpD